MENIDYEIGYPIWIEMKFLSSRKLPDIKNLILINTQTYGDLTPFYVYWTKILGIITNITTFNESHEGIEQLITAYCKSYFFCRKNIKEPEFGSLKIYTPRDTLIELKRKLKEKEIAIHSKEIAELNARIEKHFKKCKKNKRIIKFF